MRSTLLLIAVSTFLAACGGSSGDTTSGTSGASTGHATTSGATTGASTGAGSTTGSPTAGTTTGITTGGSTTGALAAGAPCTSNAACASSVCGVDGSGNCCTAACSITDPECGASACDNSGACTYPASAKSCGGTASCSNGELTAPGACDGSGTCAATTPHACAGNFACASATDCGTTCNSSTDCQSGFSCNNGACVAPAATGACTENDDCVSGVCGISGSGNCCTAGCSTTDATCGATACDLTGACTYPTGNACGTDSCATGSLTTNACDATGACHPTTASCPNGLACNAADTACLASCAGDSDCATGFYCDLGTSACVAQLTAGPCIANDQCTTGICGLSGTGNCCAAACSTGDATCGATGCDAKSAACTYPDKSVLCGSVGESCTGSTQQDPSACDGTGACNNAPGTTDCTPYICGANACLAVCTDDTSCGTGDVCDVTNSACCVKIPGDGTGTLFVDSTNGSDATACCGTAAKPCATIAHAMQLIDASQAPNVTLTATVGGAGGDWAPKGEVYPIVLGWGVELSAPAVFFSDVVGNAEIFDITNYSANDTVGYASITGTAAGTVSVGIDSTQSIQTEDLSAVQVESGNTLYLANATLNGNPFPQVAAVNGTTAITVAGGGALVLGQDQLAVNTGTVTIGLTFLDGYNGIVCGSANGLGCTITDATLTGASSVVIQNQTNLGIDAEDYASISLTSTPQIGMLPTMPGFEQCPSKDDGDFSELAIPTAILLNGAVTMTFDNGTVSCINGDGFLLQATANGSPSLTIDSSTIENTELGIYASAGTATVTKTAIQYNYNGVEQDADTTNATAGTIDLSGGGNTVACSSNIESNLGATNPGISVLNTTDQTLDASNTAWDTKPTDVFQCDPTLATCTCDSGACTVKDGADGMDAVYESSSTNITTTGNTLSTLSCAPPVPTTCDPQTQTGCAAGEVCCKSGVIGGQPSCQKGPVCKF